MLIFNSKKENNSFRSYEFIVAGLGNPGEEYRKSRHNAGFMAVDRIAAAYGGKIDRLKFKSLTGSADIAGKKVLLIKPSTFMNCSGEALTEAMRFYKIPIENVLILFDDTSIEPGRMRIRLKGSAGGHNGVKNIIYLTGRDDFPRIKIGVGGKPHPGYDLARWVLGGFSEDELRIISPVLDNCVKAAEMIVGGMAQEAMNKFNPA